MPEVERWEGEGSSILRCCGGGLAVRNGIAMRACGGACGGGSCRLRGEWRICCGYLSMRESRARRNGRRGQLKERVEVVGWCPRLEWRSVMEFVRL